VDWQALKEKFNLAVRQLVEKAKNSQNKAVDGSEDK